MIWDEGKDKQTECLLPRLWVFKAVDSLLCKHNEYGPSSSDNQPKRECRISRAERIANSCNTSCFLCDEEDDANNDSS